MLGTWSKVPEFFGQKPPTAEHPRLHRAHRHREDVRCRFESETLEIDENHGRSKLIGKRLQRGFDVGPNLGGRKVVERRRIGGIQGLG